jgi:hypothetical protein
MPAPIPDFSHGTATGVEIHTPYRWTPANAAARIAINIGASFADDVGAIAFQQDDGSVWTAIATGTGANKWVAVSVSATPSRANKAMVALTTVADGDKACATAVAFTPAVSGTNGGYIAVDCNGAFQDVGDGTKVGVSCYFSGDGGTTARALKSVIAGDFLYWNGATVAGFQLALSDRLSFHYPV